MLIKDEDVFCMIKLLLFPYLKSSYPPDSMYNLMCLSPAPELVLELLQIVDSEELAVPSHLKITTKAQG